jgi:hypothetical protein
LSADDEDFARVDRNAHRPIVVRCARLLNPLQRAVG